MLLLPVTTFFSSSISSCSVFVCMEFTTFLSARPSFVSPGLVLSNTMSVAKRPHSPLASSASFLKTLLVSFFSLITLGPEAMNVYLPACSVSFVVTSGSFGPYTVNCTWTPWSS